MQIEDNEDPPSFQTCFHLILTLHFLGSIFRGFSWNGVESTKIMAFLVFSLSFFCILGLQNESSEIILQIFIGSPFGIWVPNILSIVTLKRKLYNNLRPLRSIWKGTESKNDGGVFSIPPLCNVELMQTFITLTVH